MRQIERFSSDWKTNQGVSDMETVKLTNIEGISRLSGTDEHGNTWLQLDVDYLAEQEEGECSICGNTLETGWLCLDSGDEICDSHVSLVGT